MNTHKIDTSHYILTNPAQIGEDIDLDAESYTSIHGEPVTEESTASYTNHRAEEAKKGGRPSLQKGTSPQVTFRIPAELRDKAADIAKREGRTISAIAREQLEQYISTHEEAA